MTKLSRFGSRRIRELLPSGLREMIGCSDNRGSGAAPTGDRGIAGEREDQLLTGPFRDRYEHIYRYALVSEQRLGLVADVGCGTGYGSAIINENNDAVGIDPSDEATSYARKQYPNLDFVRGSGTSLPISDSSLDALTAFEIIEHVPDHTPMVKEFRRVLKPGGLLFLSTPNPAHLGNLLNKRLRGKPIPAKVNMENIYHLREFQYAEMLSILEASGFRVVRAFGQTIPLSTFVWILEPIRRRILPMLGLKDVYDWLLSRLGEGFPRISFTVVYIARRV